MTSPVPPHYRASRKPLVLTAIGFCLSLLNALMEEADPALGVAGVLVAVAGAVWATRNARIAKRELKETIARRPPRA